MSDGTASFESRRRFLAAEEAAAEGVRPEAPILCLPGARERVRRRRRLATVLEWAAVLGVGVAAALMLLMAVVSLTAR